MIIDVHGLAITDPCAMEDTINGLTGVVTQGLFAKRPADIILVGRETGVAEFRSAAS